MILYCDCPKKMSRASSDLYMVSSKIIFISRKNISYIQIKMFSNLIHSKFFLCRINLSCHGVETFKSYRKIFYILVGNYLLRLILILNRSSLIKLIAVSEYEKTSEKIKKILTQMKQNCMKYKHLYICIFGLISGNI